MKTEGYAKRSEIMADVNAIIEWATRDQEECAQSGDEESDREARANLRAIRKLTPELRRMVRLLWPSRATERADRAANRMRFECCGRPARHKEARCSRCPEPDNRAEPGPGSLLV